MLHLKYEEQLRKTFENVNNWLKFAEAKNLAFLSLNIALIFGLNQIEIGVFSRYSILLNFMLITLFVISLLFNVISLVPFLGKKCLKEKLINWINIIRDCSGIGEEEKRENIHFYRYLSTLKEEQYEKEFLNKINETEAFTQYERELTNQILVNSKITMFNYQLFKISSWFFLFGLLGFIVLWVMIRLNV